MAAQYDVNLDKCALLKCLCGEWKLNSALAAGLRWARCDLYCIFNVTDRFLPPPKKTRELEGMGVILLGLEQDGIFPQCFRGIGTGRDSFLWEWDGRGLKIHSCVTL